MSPGPITEPVLVTGASGFIGRHVMDALLKAGHTEVHGVLSPAAPHWSQQSCTFHRVNILEPGAITRLVAGVQPATIIHLAWIASPGTYWTSQANVAWLRASLELLEAAMGAGTRRVVQAGTCAEYDWGAGKCSEASTPLLPASIYGASKLALGTVAAGLSSRLSVAHARIFHPYGPGDHAGRLLPSVLRHLSRGERAPVTVGTQKRDFIFVADVAAALLTLAGVQDTGSFNVGTGEATAVKSVVGALAREYGAADLVDFGALASRNDQPLVVADISKISAVGWTPRTSLTDGIALTVDAWKQHAEAIGASP